ncbi:uncharacterized protein NESG_01717 [Nematocida ausubeli]|uniref:Uncharacterized protein n=1 Tax=Nematocida ausubeli (strain ATCC PRA-371 / ERTm2) TaxID=1913371 RepID=A0A086J0R5_NEMA1|nr:uncharacterized protein NESG_01717 [Nematocida ausubeli]KAI5136700.1 hypothetical protein NEAUS06_1961 [Nematocida ausubeli]KAI5149753.1 hypothetical protein NEAUS05_1890 [Nematocida ausubeli]KFG25733.1 hypothetical protein NESG_01717 [Nematocida ausubeli]
MIFNLNITINTHRNSIAPSSSMTKNNYYKKNLLYILFIISSMHLLLIACVPWHKKLFSLSKSTESDPSSGYDRHATPNVFNEVNESNTRLPIEIPDQNIHMHDNPIYEEIDPINNSFVGFSCETLNEDNIYEEIDENNRKAPTPPPRRNANMDNTSNIYEEIDENRTHRIAKKNNDPKRDPELIKELESSKMFKKAEKKNPVPT